MTTSATKLRKITDYLYCTQDRNVTVAENHLAKFRGELKWDVTYRDGLGCKVVKHFATLGAVREWLKTS